jgi:hypothetical protein
MANTTARVKEQLNRLFTRGLAGVGTESKPRKTALASKWSPNRFRVTPFVSAMHVCK